MKYLSKLQSKIFEIENSKSAVSLTLETTFYLILAVLAVSAIWLIINKFIIGDNTKGTGIGGTISQIISQFFGM